MFRSRAALMLLLQEHQRAYFSANASCSFFLIHPCCLQIRLVGFPYGNNTLILPSVIFPGSLRRLLEGLQRRIEPSRNTTREIKDLDDQGDR